MAGWSEKVSMAGPALESGLTPKDTIMSKGGRLGLGYLCI